MIECYTLLNSLKVKLDVVTSNFTFKTCQCLSGLENHFHSCLACVCPKLEQQYN